jgi:hypothetical protein
MSARGRANTNRDHAANLARIVYRFRGVQSAEHAVPAANRTRSATPTDSPRQLLVVLAGSSSGRPAQRCQCCRYSDRSYQCSPMVCVRFSSAAGSPIFRAPDPWPLAPRGGDTLLSRLPRRRVSPRSGPPSRGAPGTGSWANEPRKRKPQQENEHGERQEEHEAVGGRDRARRG